MKSTKQAAATGVASIFTKALYGIDEAAELMGVSRPTLYREVKRGELKLRKVGRKSVFHRDDLIAYVDSLPAFSGQGEAA